MTFQKFLNEFFIDYNKDWLDNEKLDDDEFLLSITGISNYDLKHYDIDILYNLINQIDDDEKEVNSPVFKKLIALLNFYEIQINEITTINNGTIHPKGYLQIPRGNNNVISLAIQDANRIYPLFRLFSKELILNESILYELDLIISEKSSLDLFIEKINFIKDNVSEQQLILDPDFPCFCNFVDKLNILKNNTDSGNDVKNNNLYERLSTFFNLNNKEFSKYNFAYKFNASEIKSIMAAKNQEQIVELVTILNEISRNRNVIQLMTLMSIPLADHILSIFDRTDDKIELKKILLLKNCINWSALYRVLNIPKKASYEDINSILVYFINKLNCLKSYEIHNLSLFRQTTLSNLAINANFINQILLKQLSELECVKTNSAIFSSTLGIDEIDFNKYAIEYERCTILSIADTIPYIFPAIIKKYDLFFKFHYNGSSQSSDSLFTAYGFSKVINKRSIRNNQRFIDWNNLFEMQINSPIDLFCKNNLTLEYILSSLKNTGDRIKQVDSILLLLNKPYSFSNHLDGIDFHGIDFNMFQKNIKMVKLALAELKQFISIFNNNPYMEVSKKMPILDENIHVFYKTKKRQKDDIIEIIIDYVKNGPVQNYYEFYNMPTIQLIDDSYQSFLQRHHIKFSEEEVLTEVFSIKGHAEVALTARRGRVESLTEYVKETISPGTANKNLIKQELIQRITKNINFIKISYHNLKSKVSSSQLNLLIDIYDRTLKIDIDQLDDLDQKQLSEKSNTLFADFSKVRSMTVQFNKK